jgi:hypothetical protein
VYFPENMAALIAWSGAAQPSGADAGDAACEQPAPAAAEAAEREYS